MAFLQMNLPGIGLTTLRSAWSNLAAGVDNAGQFQSWQPSLVADVDTAHRLSDNRRAATWEFSRMAVVSFELQGLSPSKTVNGISMVEAAQRFAFEAQYFGRQFDVGVEDGVTPARVCEVLQGTEVSLTLADPAARTYTLSLTARAIDTLAPFANAFPGLK